MSFEPRDYLHHILDEVEYLLTTRSGLTYETFESDETLRRAFVRSIEIIGEAAKHIPEGFRAEHPEIEWRAMAGMRDRLPASTTFSPGTSTSDTDPSDPAAGMLRTRSD